MIVTLRSLRIIAEYRACGDHKYIYIRNTEWKLDDAFAMVSSRSVFEGVVTAQLQMVSHIVYA